MGKIILICVLTFTFNVGCKSYSNYAIDEEPIIKTDPSFYGIWKCEEDEDKNNAVIIQTYDDVQHYLADQYGGIDNYLQDLQLRSKTNPFLYEELQSEVISFKNRAYEYYITTTFRLTQYNQFNVFLSEIGKTRFLNVSYWQTYYKPGKNGDSQLLREEKGYFFLRILAASDHEVTTALVADETLKKLKDAGAVRERLSQRLNQKNFYSDTLHFYKISNYHGDQNKALRIAKRYMERD